MVSSLWPDDAICWHECGLTLVKVTACCLTAPSYCLKKFLIIENWTAFRWEMILRSNLSVDNRNSLRLHYSPDGLASGNIVANFWWTQRKKMCRCKIGLCAKTTSKLTVVSKLKTLGKLKMQKSVIGSLCAYLIRRYADFVQKRLRCYPYRHQ